MRSVQDLVVVIFLVFIVYLLYNKCKKLESKEDYTPIVGAAVEEAGITPVGSYSERSFTDQHGPTHVGRYVHTPQIYTGALYEGDGPMNLQRQMYPLPSDKFGPQVSALHEEERGYVWPETQGGPYSPPHINQSLSNWENIPGQTIYGNVMEREMDGGEFGTFGVTPIMQ